VKHALAIALLSVGAAVVPVGMILIHHFLGGSKPNPIKSQPFECGVEPFEHPDHRIPIKFYVTAMLFILFDIEIVFLYPWAAVSRQLGWFGFAEMVVFLLILIGGFVYLFQRRAFEWE